MLDFLLGEALKVAALLASFQVSQVTDARLNGLEVGEHTSQPALIDVKHAAALRLFRHSLLSLLLCANEENRAAASYQLFNKFVRLIETRHRLLEINDMDAIAVHENELLHLGVPAPGLMPEMDASL